MIEQLRRLLDGITADIQETKKLADGDYDPAHAFMRSALSEAEKANLVIQARLERIKAAERDFAADGEAIVTKVEVVKVEEKRWSRGRAPLRRAGFLLPHHTCVF